ncbi:hypothetical protein C7H19_00065 [Aphanothece hegewaldii CCALA 016]|uniref:Uncharacterized protein n=1 Tax=Aphanothece hegewaldii CCALA 016 TaxID=2107694 RepID=A0A2T1M317_9CHRO|nr:hypothetical protein [Aphanothece hegewaldii]PSF39222.1 hypothetical protein C7H19_00065 [Aphanothece hegewaldii CCALA 016]
MAIIALKAWYLEHYEPIKDVVKRPHDLRLNRNSLLKSGLRADFLDDSLDVQASLWFQRYLEGETVEFYIEGSGGYVISNIDLISHEIYLTKQDITSWLEPIIYFSPQLQYPSSSVALRETLLSTIATYNKRSRYSVSLEETPFSKNAPLRLSDTQLRKIRKSLLFIADGTPIHAVDSNLLVNPNVCVELGYAISTKQTGQILFTYLDRPELKGEFSFDFPQHQQLKFTSVTELKKTLPSLIETLLQRFNLTTG